MSDLNKKIVILSSYLNVPGGYEKMISSAANLFASKGWQVTILILDSSKDTYYPIDERVTIIQEDLSFGISGAGNMLSRKIDLLKHIRKLKAHFSTLQPGIVLSTEYVFSVAAILSGVQKKAKVFSWEHHHFYWLKKNRFWAALIRRTYPKLDAVICMTEAEKRIFEEFSRVIVIPNFIVAAGKNVSAEKPKRMLSVGGLIPRKGIDLLLPIAKKILDAHPDWSWKLIGDGVMKYEVLQFIKANNLNGRFILEVPPGPDISAEYDKAALFVLTSRYEAFGMVLVEAMSFAVPCVSFDCPSGPSEIIDNKIDGLLARAEETAELTKHIEYLVQHENVRIEMGKHAREKSDRYLAENIYPLWEDAFIGSRRD